MGDSKKVMLIGWDAADWKIINDMLDLGLLPTIRHVRRHNRNIARVTEPRVRESWRRMRRSPFGSEPKGGRTQREEHSANVQFVEKE